MALPHSALAPSGQPIWLDMARRSRQTLCAAGRPRRRAGAIFSPMPRSATRWWSIAAFGGSTNLLLHLPAIAYSAGLRRPTVDDWIDVNRRVPRLVRCAAERPGRTSDGSCLLGRRRAGSHAAPPRPRTCWTSTAATITGQPLGEMLEWWETSPRRQAVRQWLMQSDRRRSR